MPALKHIHTYVRYKSKPDYYRCNAPGCTHWLLKELVLNKYSLCTQCGTQFIMTSEHLTKAKPRCINCMNTKKAKAARTINEQFATLGTEAFNPFNNPLPNAQLEFDPVDEEFKIKLEKEDREEKDSKYDGY